MSGQELALIPATAAERWKYAETLADANLIPAAFRRRPADVFYAVEYGAMLGLSPVAAMTGIHVIEGKPTASSALMSALVRKAGHRLRVRVEGKVSDGTLTATAELVRADDPDHPFTATWDLQRAERAGLLSLKTEDGRVIPWSRSEKGKPQAWEKFPEAMAKARAISEVCRDGAEECLFGMHYTPEELGADVDGDGDVVSVTVTQDGATPAGGIPQPSPAGDDRRPSGDSAADVVDAEIVEEQTPQQQAVVPDEESLAFVAEVAKRAADSDDADEIRNTFTRIRAERGALLTVDVAPFLTDDLLSTATPASTVDAQGATRVELGAWLIACGKHAKDAAMSVAESARMDPALSDDPWAVTGDPQEAEVIAAAVRDAALDAEHRAASQTPATDGAPTLPIGDPQ